MSPFDRAHMTSYSTLLETVRLSCTVLSYLSKVAKFNLPPPALGASVGDDSV